MAGERQRLFTELVLPHLGDALSLARWLTGDGADAEDVVQEACLRAFGALESCEQGEGRPWLLAIVRNSAFTFMARNRRKSMIVTDDAELFETASAATPAECMTPEAELIARADGELVRGAIAALPPQFREPLVLREFSGCSYREIADIIRAPIGTVMSRLARARALLMAEIARRLSPEATS